MTEEITEMAVLKLLREAAESRLKLAQSMLAAYAADALPLKATPEDIALWETEAADAESEIQRLRN